MSDAMTKKVVDMLYSSTHLFALPFEKNFSADNAIAFAANNWPLAIGLVIGYLVFITAGSKIMANLKPFDLRMALAGWNMLLSVFSFLGMCRTVSLPCLV